MDGGPIPSLKKESEDSIELLTSTIGLLRSEDLFEQERSLRIIINLTAQKPPSRDLIRDHGGFEAISGLLLRSPNDVVRMLCIWALSNLCCDNASNASVFGKNSTLSNVVELLVTVVNEDVVQKCFWLLINLTTENQENRHTLVRFGILGALIVVLEESPSIKLLLEGEKLLRNLFRENDLQLKFVEVGGLSLLKSFLFASQEDVRVLSVNLILNLSAFHESIRQWLLDEKVLTLLMSILHEEATSTTARKSALMACHNFSLDQKGERQLIEQGAVSTAVEILTLNHDPALQKESVALLASLSNSMQAAREMAEKGAVPELVELLSSNDEELLTDLVNLASNLANQDEGRSQLSRLLAGPKLISVGERLRKNNKEIGKLAQNTAARLDIGSEAPRAVRSSPSLSLKSDEKPLTIPSSGTNTPFFSQSGNRSPRPSAASIPASPASPTPASSSSAAAAAARVTVPSPQARSISPHFKKSEPTTRASISGSSQTLEKPSTSYRLSDSAPDPLKPMYKKRRAIVSEILSTEKAFILRLNIVLTVYLEPLKSKGILSARDAKNLFQNIDAIQAMHTEFLNKLEPIVNDPTDEAVQIGKLFVSLANKIRTTYPEFVMNYDLARYTYELSQSKNKRFKDFLDAQTSRTDVRGANLMLFLISPIQRVPRLALLLEELQKYTPAIFPDVNEQNDALNAFRTLSTFLDEACARGTAVTKIVRIQDSLIDYNGDSLVDGQHRLYVREATFFEKSRKGPKYIHLFMLTDMVVVTRPKKFKFKFKRVWMLTPQAGLQVLPLPVERGDLYPMRVAVKDHGEVLLYTNSISDRDTWVRAMQEACLLQSTAKSPRTSKPVAGRLFNITSGIK